MSGRAQLLSKARTLADAAEQALDDGEWDAATDCSERLRNTLEDLFGAQRTLAGEDIASLQQLHARTTALVARALERRHSHTGDLLEFRAKSKAARSYDRHR